MTHKQLYYSPTLNVEFFDTFDVCTASVPTSFDNDEVQDDVYGGIF